MGINYIGGLPRSGKSYFITYHMTDELMNSDRHIYTSLPIHPDRIAKYVTKIKYSKEGVFWASYLPLVLSRIHIYKTFSSRAELLRFKKINPLFCNQHRHRDRSKDISVSATQQLIYPLELIMEYYLHCRSNSIFYFDESYQFWKSTDGSLRDAESKERRSRLQTYVRQHGHYDDDIYIISHREHDLDKTILYNARYLVKNMRNYPIIPEVFLDKYWWLRPFMSLTYPLQFFRIHVYIGDDKSHLNTRDIFPKSFIFTCYDSKSHAETLGKKMTHNSDSAESNDYKKSYVKDLRDWLRSAWLPLCMLIMVCYTFYGVMNFLWKTNVSYKDTKKMMGYPDDKKTDKKIDEKKDIAKPEPSGQGGKQRVSEQKKVEVKVTGVTPSSLYLSDGRIIRKGSKYVLKNVSCDVLAVSRDYVTLSAGKKTFSVSVALLLGM